MRQRNGATLFSANDPRAAAVGIIDVDPEDDRQSVLTAILTQERLNRRQTVIVLPLQSSVFQHPSDFKEIEQALRNLHNLQTQLVFVAPADSNSAKFARQRHYLVFPSLENYAHYAQTFLNGEPSPIALSPADATPPTSPPLSDIVPEAEASSTSEPDTPAPPLDEDTASSPPSQDASQHSQPIGTPPDQQATPDPTPVEPPLAGRPFRPLATIFSRGVQPVQRAAPPASRQRRPIRRYWPLAALLLLLILLGGSILGVLSGFIPLARILPGIASATITIIPDSKQLQSTYAITAVLSQPDTAQQQIQARYLSYTTPTQTRTVAALGLGTLPATQAQGFLTFYNALPFEQKVPAGTVFTDDKGVQVANDESVVIPSAKPPTEGFVTTPAHALVAGAAGNLPALHFNFLPCCRSGVTVENIDAFHGGQDQQTYAYIQQSDIDNAAQLLQPALVQRGQSALKAQTLAQERLVAPFQCFTAITASSPAGTRVDKVTVTVKVTCAGEVYNQQAAQYLAENQFKKDGTARNGANYALIGPIKITITGITPVDTRGTVLLHVMTAGRWIYQFYEPQKGEIVRSVAGHSTQQAQSILTQQRGVSRARIDLFLAAENTLPNDPRRITLILQPPS